MWFLKVNGLFLLCLGLFLSVVLSSSYAADRQLMLEELERNLQNQKHALEELAKKWKTLEGQLSVSTSELAALQERWARLEKDYQLLLEEFTNLRSSHTKLESSSSYLEDLTSDLSTSFANYERQVEKEMQRLKRNSTVGWVLLGVAGVALIGMGVAFAVDGGSR